MPCQGKPGLERDGGGGSRQSSARPTLTPQERCQYDWYVKKYQNQAEEAVDEKDAKRAEVTPITSTAFSFSSEDSEFDEETGTFASMKLRCPLCVPTKRDVYVAYFDADSMY